MGSAASLPPLPADVTDRAAMGAYLDAHRLYVAAEVFQSIRALAADARGGQWVHKDTAEALDRILEFAAIGVGATTDDEDESSGDEGWSPDFPP